jgi:tetratricopeptide (TPR) repeat protein
MNKTRGLLLWVLAPWALQAWAVPDGPIADAKPVTAVAPEGAMAARLAYNVGYEDFEKAQATEAAAAKLTGAPAKAAQAQALQSYATARKQFEAATKADPSLKEAWNLVGYTSRRLGEYDKSLAAYERALALNPTYSEAIEYRAEAYLALNRLDDAKAAYLTLLANARPHAAVLLQSMQQWLAERRKQPAGVAAADLDAFARWVDERAAVASQTASLAPGFVPVRRWD